MDLNTTARKNEKTVEKASPYLIHNTYSTVISNLARPIGHFQEEAELLEFKKQLAAEKALLEGEEAKPESPAAETPGEESRPGTQLEQSLRASTA